MDPAEFIASVLAGGACGRFALSELLAAVFREDLGKGK